MLHVIYVLYALIHHSASSEYQVFDSLGQKSGTFQYNTRLSKRASPSSLSKRASPSSQIIQEINHDYYKSLIFVNDSAWIEINPTKTSFDQDVVHEGLSSSFRYAYNILLPFTFPYYGLPLETITPTTGGFIFVGELIHNQLTETQYIAPLMAEFDPSLGNDSYIYYYLSDNVAIVQWDNVYLHSDYDPNSSDNQAFTFQAQLYKSGDIVFAYKEVPYHPKLIDDTSHYVRVGIAEAYYEVDTSHGVTVTYVHQYHSIDLDFDLVVNYTEITLQAEKTCLSSKSCADCTTQEIDFECSWCPKIQQCSDGISRWRQNWKDAKCDASGVTKLETCPNEEESALPSTHASTGFYEIVLCQDSKTAIVCSGEDTLLIDSASFSRTNYYGSLCQRRGEGNDGSQCQYDNDYVLNKLAAKCNHNRACIVEASAKFFETDPCPDTPKTLNVYYKCKSHATAADKALIAFIVILLLCLVGGLALWVVYAYRNPTTPSGLFLIKYGRFWKGSIYKEDTGESGI